MYRASGKPLEELFSLTPLQFISGMPTAEMITCEYEYVEALTEKAKEKDAFPDMSNDTLTRNYPGQYQSLLQIIHTTGERIGRRVDPK